MKELYDLKEMLLKELEEYGKKGDLSAGTLEIVDKLAHATKNLCKILEEDDSDYSGYYPMYYGRDSYARGRGRNARRDSMGRYSREGSDRMGGYSRADFAEELRAMMQDAPDERTRQDIQRIVAKVEQM